MAYQVTDARIGSQPIADTSTTQLHPLGTIVRANDPTYGEGEFIYLLGVVSTVVGSPVNYNPTTHQTALAPAGSNIPESIAFAMSANVASQYGWYQIGGLTVAAKSTGAMTVGTAVGISTAGFINATATGKEVSGAVVAATVTAAETTVQLQINRPHMQGRIT
ncbi:MAG: hypothetical protein WC236_15575 [Gallionellaceae bacterium]|jgi:hypothetical protein